MNGGAHARRSGAAPPALIPRRAARADPAPRPTPGLIGYHPAFTAPPADGDLRLVAIRDCWVEFTTLRGVYRTQLVVPGGTSRRWAFRYPIDMRPGNPAASG